jgi:Polyketide cyclase / dehydrase and lipid transport
MTKGLWENAIQINASATLVERCLTELALIQRWRNGLVIMMPIDDWSTVEGSRSRLLLQSSLLPVTLRNRVVHREPGLIVWEFTGWLRGKDCWECLPTDQGTKLVNRWGWQVNNPWLNWWWRYVGSRALKDDIEAQLMRIKYVAEELHYLSGLK